ncbi:MAG: hypothetical protein Q8O19_02480, partial [Rectinemataceae bacterium]|nr:hypothetical protein [Rectinemataceae bacterium]
PHVVGIFRQGGGKNQEDCSKQDEQALQHGSPPKGFLGSAIPIGIPLPAFHQKLHEMLLHRQRSAFPGGGWK